MIGLNLLVLIGVESLMVDGILFLFVDVYIVDIIVSMVCGLNQYNEFPLHRFVVGLNVNM